MKAAPQIGAISNAELANQIVEGFAISKRITPPSLTCVAMNV
jgi:hypothetical protein